MTNECFFVFLAVTVCHSGVFVICRCMCRNGSTEIYLANSKNLHSKKGKEKKTKNRKRERKNEYFWWEILTKGATKCAKQSQTSVCNKYVYTCRYLNVNVISVEYATIYLNVSDNNCTKRNEEKKKTPRRTSTRKKKQKKKINNKSLFIERNMFTDFFSFGISLHTKCYAQATLKKILKYCAAVLRQPNKIW